MKFKSYNTIRLATAPAPGVNPPDGRIFEWYTVDGSNIIVHRRSANGDDVIVAINGATGSICRKP